MQMRVRVSSADICQHAVRKRTASEAGPSRPSKKSRATASMPGRATASTQAPAAASTPTGEPDVPSASIPKPILVLSAPTVLPIAPPGEGATREGTAAATSVAPPTEEVWAKVEATAESEQSAAAPLVHDMFDLEASYIKFDDFRRTWMNKVAAADAEKVAALEQLKSAAEREDKLQQEVS
uniref:Arabinogalactan protein 1-like n=1 Tax=Elaeis guineensis var. tenera TaxID=51953 RepID=A0A6I9S9P7_ELAGV|nr:arabinogalactan protein 1-like [Elaeis guineensis]